MKEELPSEGAVPPQTERPHKANDCNNSTKDTIVDCANWVLALGVLVGIYLLLAKACT
jgi:hypothetical protein